MLGHYISNSLRDYLVFLVAGKITLSGGKPLDLQKLETLSKDISDTFCSFLNRYGFFHFVLDIFILEKRIYIYQTGIYLKLHTFYHEMYEQSCSDIGTTFSISVNLTP